MAPSPAWLHRLVNASRKPLDKHEYRVLAVLAALSSLLGATIGFIAVPRWELALAIALLSIPGGLLGGALLVWLQRLNGQPMLRIISSFAVLLVMISAAVGLRHIIPSWFGRVVFYAVLVAVASIALRAYRRARGGPDSKKRGG